MRVTKRDGFFTILWNLVAPEPYLLLCYCDLKRGNAAMVIVLVFRDPNWPHSVVLLLPRPHTPGSWHHMSSIWCHVRMGKSAAAPSKTNFNSPALLPYRVAKGRCVLLTLGYGRTFKSTGVAVQWSQITCGQHALRLGGDNKQNSRLRGGVTCSVKVSRCHCLCHYPSH